MTGRAAPSVSKPTDPRPGSASPALPIGLFSLGFVIATAAGWWIVDPIKYAVLAASRDGEPLSSAARAAVAAQAPAIGLAAILLLAAVLTLAWMESRGRALSRAIETARPGWIALLLGCVLLWFGHAYLYPGWMLAGDAGAHVARVVQLGLALRDGEWPIWSNRFYLGSPFLQFTGPLFFQIGGVLAALIGDGMLATKILLFALHLVAGFAAYGLMRQLDAPRLPALAGTIVYAGAWAHLHLFVYSGVLPQAITLALLPLVLIAADRCIRQEETRSGQSGPGRHWPGWSWVALALGTAGLLANHQPHGVFAGVYLALFCLYGWWRHGAAPLPLLRVALAGAAGIVVAAYAIVPYLAERDTVMASGPGNLFQLALPSLDELARLALWSNRQTSSGAESAAYLGTTALLLATAGLVGWYRDRATGRPRLGGVPLFAACFVLSLLLTGSFIRDIQFTLLFLAPLVAQGVMSLSQMSVRRSGTVGLCLVAAILLDLGPTALQPLNRTDKAYYATALSYLEGQPDRGRVVLVGSGGWSQEGDPAAGKRYLVSAGPSVSPLAWGAVSFVNGPHNQTATPAHNPAIAVLLRLERELNEGAVGAETLRLLALLDVGRVIYDDGTAFGFPDALRGTVPEGPLGRILAVPEATPVLFAPALAPADIAPADVPLLWPTMGDTATARQAEAVVLADFATLAPDFVRGLAAAIAVPAGSEAAEAGPLPPGGAVRLIAFSEGRQTVTARLETPAAGFVRLAYAAHPWVRATVNGETVTPIRTLTGLIAVPVPAGVVEIALGAEASGLRRGFTILSLAAFVGVLATPWIGRLSGRGRSTKSPLRDRGRL